MPLVYLSCAWVAGIFLGSKLDLSLFLALVGIIPLSLLFFAPRYKKAIILMGLGLIIFLVAVPYAYSRLHAFDDSILRFYNDRGSVVLKGMVARDPEVGDKSTHLELSTAEIKLADKWQAVEGTALIFVPRYPAYKYGDVLLISGNLDTPSQIDDFDYKGYLVHQGIYSTMLYPEIEVLERDKGNRLLMGIYSLRDYMAQTLARVLPEPQASLAKAIVLGMRGTMPLPLKTDFARSGTAHLLAISGLHLGIIVGMLLSFGIWLLGRRHYRYIWLALVALWLYAILTGLNPPVVRGAIMASLFLAAELLGRQRSALTALTLAAAIMVGISPYILGNASFQLSFLAMAGLVLLYPGFRNLGRRIIGRILGEDGAIVSLASMANDAFSATLAALIAVWPVIAYYFGIASLIAPLATFLALPALPAIIISGAITGILGFFLPVAQAMGWLTWLFLSYLLAVASGLGSSPVASIEVTSMATPFIVAYYFILALSIWLSRYWKTLTGAIAGVSVGLMSGTDMVFNLISGLSRKWAMPPLLAIAALVSFGAATMPDDDLHVSFLDVGEGDAILIQQGSQQVLIDGGPSPQAINLALGNRMPFWDRTLELVILTHPHQDHLGGLVEVLQRFHVEQVICPDLDYQSPSYDKWLETIKEGNIKITTARAGQQVDLGKGTVIRVLNPQSTSFSGTQSDVDNNGVVLRLSQGSISFLLAADIMKEAEFELIGRRAALTSTVLKVAHHGSATSTTQEFMSVVSPQLAVISVGADNKFGHPDEGVLQRLREIVDGDSIYRTDRDGAIEFITDGDRLWLANDGRR